MSDRRIAPVLALDIGNVAVRIDPIPLLNLIGFESMDAFNAYDADKAIWNGCMAFENGELTADEFARWFTAAVPATISEHDVPGIWCSLVRAEIPGIADIVDNCPVDSNPTQLDSDADGLGDVCDELTDSDEDGIANDSDNCPLTANADQSDTDADGLAPGRHHRTSPGALSPVMIWPPTRTRKYCRSSRTSYRPSE